MAGPGDDRWAEHMLIVYPLWLGSMHESLERNIVGFCGIGPIWQTRIGMVAAKSDAKRKHHPQKMREFGRRAR